MVRKGISVIKRRWALKVKGGWYLIVLVPSSIVAVSVAHFFRLLVRYVGTEGIEGKAAFIFNVNPIFTVFYPEPTQAIKISSRKVGHGPQAKSSLVCLGRCSLVFSDTEMLENQDVLV